MCVAGLPEHLAQELLKNLQPVAHDYHFADKRPIEIKQCKTFVNNA